MASSEKNDAGDPRKRLSCSTCFDAVWFCYSPFNQMQQYYRAGTLDNCGKKWSALYDCLVLKTKRSSELEKHWQNYVKTWFNQPARRNRRRVARQKKALKIFPRPTSGPLSQAVRGFSLEELKAAIGIAVDHRRRNASLEGLQTNVQRLETYKAKLVAFPRRARKTKAGDSTPEELATATQVQGSYMPIAREKPSVEPVKVTPEMKAFMAYNKIRLERTNERHIGVRAKRAAEAEKEDKKYN